MTQSIDAVSASQKRATLYALAAKSSWKATKQTPSEWGASNRVYGPETGVPGRRDPYLTPYAVPFATNFGDPKYRRVVLVTGAQSGKTESFLDIIGERLDNRPAPILYVGPSKEFLTDQFEPRVVSLFEQAASLKAKVLGGISGKRQKRTLKRVNGVRLRLAHAGSSTALKSDPAAIALVDEYDEMLRNVKDQGDPLGLVEARGITYADFVTGITSTPSLGMVEIDRDPATGLEFWKVAEADDVTSPIWRLWQEGTRHHWAWPCPHCAEYFIPRFNLLKGLKLATPAQARREAFIQCPRVDCGGVIEEKHKADMNARGRYVAPGQSIDRDGVVTGEPPETSTLSFWVSGLASPFVTIGQRAETYLTALRSNESAKIQTATNAEFGEVYVDGSGDVPPWEEIFKRREGAQAPLTIPDGARYLTAGVDVQKNRVVFVVRAWGARATSWLVQHGELFGQTAQPEVWEELAELLTAPIDGRLIKLAFIDSGFRPGKKEGVPVNRVYEFCRRFSRFAFPTKGSSVALVRPLVKSKIEVNAQGDQKKYGLDLIRLDPDHWKSFVHERLKWPRDQQGAWHLNSEVTEDYCRQLVAEARIVLPTGKPQWIERSRENHFLDAEAMAAAAGYMLNVQHLRGGSPSPAEQGASAPTAAPTSAPALPPAAVAAATVPKKNRFADLAARLNR
jgi:phage terminase large subunit GpA-like protein